MRVVKKYSHLNGEEWLIVHENDTYEEILTSLRVVNANEFCRDSTGAASRIQETKLDPVTLASAFCDELSARGWSPLSHSHCVAGNSDQIKLKQCETPHEPECCLTIQSADTVLVTHQIDHFKNRIGVKMRFDRSESVVYDLYGRYLPFCAEGMIEVGIEILPTKAMQQEMSSGIAYYEGELHNILRHGRSNPPVPLVIIGVEPD